ncbi:hypothetical protein FHR38_000127 [Micromonospora polyrhachis]|uniref:Uncharacterized protein n=1 Tax=Micromonospora polyrhachis TaxID=1282883 RepID=A0A7W7SKI8_9ACTN|nr:hypothetical protein [Micromonospora polyrhachis]
MAPVTAGPVDTAVLVGDRASEMAGTGRSGLFAPAARNV